MKNKKVEELIKRVRLTDERIIEALRLAYNRPNLPIECVTERDRVVAQAATNKVLNDKDLALIDREKELPDKICAGCSCYFVKNGKELFAKRMIEAGYLPVIPLSELKEVKG